MALGDHIAVARTKLFVTYYHHGIDIGDGSVIHFTGTRKKDARVIQTSIAEFLNGGAKEVIEYVRFVDVLLNYKTEMRSPHGRDHWLLPFLDDARIGEVISRIAEPLKAVKVAKKHLGDKNYSLFSNNCEHFAVYCKTGIAISLQAIEYQKISDMIMESHRSGRADHIFQIDPLSRLGRF